MSLSLNNSWDKVVPLREIVSLFLAVDEALEGFLGDYAVRAIPSYSVDAKSGSVDRKLRSELKGAIDALGGSPRALNSRYTEPYDAFWTGRSVRLSVLDILGDVCVSLVVEGQNEELAQGQFHTVSNQISALIEREFPTPIIGEKLNNGGNALTGTTTSPERSWIARTWRDHMAAFIITIVGGTVSGLIILFVVGHP